MPLTTARVTGVSYLRRRYDGGEARRDTPVVSRLDGQERLLQAKSTETSREASTGRQVRHTSTQIHVEDLCSPAKGPIHRQRPHTSHAKKRRSLVHGLSGRQQRDRTTPHR